MSSHSAESKHVPSAETEKPFTTYAAAATEACRWVDSGKHGKKHITIDVSQLKLYKSRLKKSVAHDRIVGVGLQTGVDQAGEPIITPYVRLDIDDPDKVHDQKGIHFNATQLADSGVKLAAILTPTVTMDKHQRTTLYLDYLKGIENRSAEFIWRWWLTGVPPTH